MNMKKIIIISIVIFLTSFWLPVIFDNTAQAAGATLFLSPGSGSYSLGKSFSVKVMVNSGGGVGINAAEGEIHYNPAYLLVTSLSQAGSIFNLWTTNPTYSNTDGKVTFGGGSPSAYKGNAGSIFSITFTAKKTGDTDVTFTSGIVLAADGKGTNVFSGFGQGKYTITEEQKTTAPPEEKPQTGPKGILPPLPEISSPSHPDGTKWYADNNPEFDWKIISDLTGVSYNITSDPADPGNKSIGVTETKKFEEVADGEQYFNIKYQNKYGWGQTAHKKFMVDVTPPIPFDITIDNGGDPTNPVPKLKFRTDDVTSGIDYFDITVGDQKIKAAPTDIIKQGYYQPDPLAPAKYDVSIVAVDRAQNTSSSTLTFVIMPLKAPIITSIPKIIDKNSELVIQGTSFYSQVTLKLYMTKDGKDTAEYAMKTDDDGNWSYIPKDKPDKGNYEVWAKIIDDRGAQSLDSTRYIMTIVSPAIIATYGWWIILVLLAIIAVLIWYIIYQRKSFAEERARIMGETLEVKDKLRKIFSALREEMDELIEMADKRPGFSETERRVKEKIQESLDISEEFIGKEVEDIEKEIKISKKDTERK